VKATKSAPITTSPRNKPAAAPAPEESDWLAKLLKF
jgi:hypothetical protein